MIYKPQHAMKRFLMLFGFTAFLSPLFAVHIKIEKKNGGTCGYKNVSETHTPNGHDLLCSEPGNEKCAWEYPPKIVDAKTAQTLIDIIDEQVRNGFTGGILFVESLNIKVSVSKVNINKDGVISYVAEFDY